MGYEQYTSGEHFWFIECWTQWSVVTKVFWSVVSQKKRCVVVGIVELRRFEVVRLWSKAQCGVWGCWIWKVVECSALLCRVALKVVGSVGTRLTPHLCNALPTDRPNLLQNILLIQNITEYNKIFQNIPTLFTNHRSVLQNIQPIQNITESKHLKGQLWPHVSDIVLIPTIQSRSAACRAA